MHVLSFDFPSVLLMQYSKKFSMVLDGSIMISTDAWPIDCFLVLSSTENLHRLSICCISFLYSSLGSCHFRSIRCAWSSSHVLSFYRHHYESPYGSRGEETRLNFSCFSSSVKLQYYKTYNNFLGIHNITTSPCRPLEPSSLSVPLSGFLAV